MVGTTTSIKSTWKLKGRKKTMQWEISVVEIHQFNRDPSFLLLIRNRNMSGNGG